MKDKYLNIIAFDVPYPPNYGGICDVFYKLKHLHAQGAKIVYHCFYYEGHNPPTRELEKYCEELHYYKRKKSLFRLVFSPLPYIVSSRQDPQLLENLLSNDYPILFDGIQCCFYLNTNAIKKRKRLFRANNVEHKYYAGLAKSETKLLKKIYLKREAKKLKKFERELKGVDAILSVARVDMPHFEQYGKTYHLPPFFDDKSTSIKTDEGQERFILFQGNLSVKENDVAANFILDKVASGSKQQFVIAGLNPSSKLITKVAKFDNVKLYASPKQEKMDELIGNAHIHLLITNQRTGIKLKLLNALQCGKHVLINSLMDDDGIFGKMCKVADEPGEMIREIDALMKTDFTQEMFDLRKAEFSKYYDNAANARNILELI